jgi:type IV pilus assembly protein PilX
MKNRPRSHRAATRQLGVVLIIAMIFLVVLSLISVAAIRSAGSTEITANNARQHALALQAAEAALRHCETGAVNFMKGTGTLQITPEPQPSGPTATYTWQSLAKWDGATSLPAANPYLTVLASGDVNTHSGSGKLYKRFPECMVQVQYNVPTDPSRVVITARGFGPDVQALNPTTRAAPQGAEVWLQSMLTYKP